MQKRVSPATANRVIAGIDHSGRPTSLIAALNNSTHIDAIVRISK
jgi:hypothetical protein